MNGSIAVQAWPHLPSQLRAAALLMMRQRADVQFHEIDIFDTAELTPLLAKQIGAALQLDIRRRPNGRASQ